MSEYVVIGLGRFGRSLARELQALGHEVVGVDSDRDTVQEMSDSLAQVVQADAAAEATLRELEVGSLDGAVVAVGGHVESSILVTVILKKLGVKYVISKAQSDLHGEILQRVGADRVVYPERETALRLAHSIAVPEIIDYLPITPEMGVSRLLVPPFLVGKSAVAAKLDEQYRVRLLAIVREKSVSFAPSVTEVFQPGDILLLAGEDESLSRLHRRFEAEGAKQG